MKNFFLFILYKNLVLNNHIGPCKSLMVECKPIINILDKSGMTALNLALLNKNLNLASILF